jgi:hypothetical protein
MSNIEDSYCLQISIFLYRMMEGGKPDSAVGIATGYGLEGRGVGVRVPVVSRIVSSPRRPDRLWGAPNLLSNRYLVLFTRG